VEAWGSAHVVARESAHVVASRFVAVHKQPSHTGPITGGVVIAVEIPKTAEDWCAYYGATVTNGVAVLYKGVADDYRSGHGFLYTPGTMPEAPDWDGGRNECGGGLHFCATPGATLQFMSLATRFLACPVAIADLRAPHLSDSSPEKIKARRICGPIVEVDRSGKPLTSKVSA
jgi:hypothetical protein